MNHELPASVLFPRLGLRRLRIRKAMLHVMTFAGSRGVAAIRGVCGLAACLALLGGCASRGRPIDQEMVSHIREGVTTSEDIRAWFGDPGSVRSGADQGSKWRFDHEEQTTRSTSTLTRIGRAIASAFGWRVFSTPLDVEYKNTIRHRLDVWFDAAGVVTDYQYERTETPSRRVY